MRVLCISGKRFAGKDTFARLLVESAARCGSELQTYAFAAESKRMFAAARPEVELQKLLDDREYKETWRPALTKFTVDMLAADPLVFVREVMRRISASGAPALITDLRLRLEIDHLRTVCEPYVFRITRRDALRAASGWTYDAAKDQHHTETELDDYANWTEVVPNDGTEDELAARANGIAQRLFARAT